MDIGNIEEYIDHIRDILNDGDNYELENLGFEDVEDESYDGPMCSSSMVAEFIGDLPESITVPENILSDVFDLNTTDLPFNNLERLSVLATKAITHSIGEISVNGEVVGIEIQVGVERLEKSGDHYEIDLVWEVEQNV